MKLSSINIGVTSKLATAVLLALCSSVQAQEDADTRTERQQEDVEIIQVKGIRGSLQNAAARKRDSAQFIDAIVSEDIGKLPDNNVAESLQRVSGVQISRSAGEGSSVAIRGIRENRIEINGRTYVSPYGRGIDDSTAGGGEQNILRFLPSEVISALIVTKQLSADQIDGSLGGTINVQTRKPLSDPGFHASVGADALYDDLGGDTTGKLSFLISNTFADDKFGIQLSGVTGSRNTTEEKFWNFGGWVPMDGVDPNGDGINAYRMGDLRYQTSSDERDDTALNLMAEYAPNSDTKYYIEILHTDSENQNNRDWFAANTSGNLADYNGTEVFSSNDSLLAGTYSTSVQGNSNHSVFKSTTQQFAFGAEFYVTDKLEAKAEFSYSNAELTETQAFLRAQTSDNYEVSFDFRGGDFASLTVPTDIDFQDPSLYVYSVGFDRIFLFDTEETAAKVDFNYPLDGNFIDTIDFGLRVSDLTATKDFQEQVFRPGINAADPSVSSLAVPVNRDGVLGSADGVSFPTRYLIPDTSGGPGYCALYVPDCPGPVQSARGFYEVKDTIKSAYIKANFFSEIGDMPLSGNFGVRFSDTETTVNNTALLRAETGNIDVPVSVVNDYTDVLPSAVAKLELNSDLFLRLGYSKVIARPNTRDLAVALDVDPKEFSATAGNPKLEPFRADQIDASIEWYGEDQTSVTVGVFIKNIDTFIVTETSQEQLPGFGDDTYLVQRKFNGEGGDVKGVEITYQQPFTFLPEPFDGFGLLFNYALIDSSTDLVNSRTGKELPIFGLSENNFNVISYFENDVVSARIAYNWRDEYVSTIGAGGAAVFVDDFASLDVSFRYNFTEDISVDLDAVNLLNEKQDQYVGTPDAQWVWADTGTRFTLGIRVNF